MKIQNRHKNKRTFTSRELVQLLTAKGFKYARSSGDHDIYKKGDKTVAVNVGEVNRMLARRIIKENNLLSEEPDSEEENENDSTVIRTETAFETVLS